MKKKVFAAVTIIMCLFAQTFTAAQAQQYADSKGSYKIDPTRLQKAEWNKSPLEVHILDMSPVVKDFRTRQKPDSFTINLGEIPETPGTNFVVNAPSPVRSPGDNSASRSSARSPASITMTGLPRAGFEANAPLLRKLNSALPPGSSTNLLANAKATVNAHLAAKPATGHSAAASTAPALKQTPCLLHQTGDYTIANKSSSLSSSSSSRVIGVLKSRLK